MKSFKSWGMLLIAVGMICFLSCGKSEEGIISLEEYIEQNNITLTKTTPNGVGILITQQGGAKPTSTSTVTVNYRGFLTNGNTFDSGSNITFGLQQVIPGWTEGIPEIGVGGSGTLFIPTNMAYGARPPSRDIPANADLIFEVDLLDIQ